MILTLSSPQIEIIFKYMKIVSGLYENAISWNGPNTLLCCIMDSRYNTLMRFIN